MHMLINLIYMMLLINDELWNHDVESYVDLRAYALHVELRADALHVELRTDAIHVELRAYALTR